MKTLYLWLKSILKLWFCRYYTLKIEKKSKVLRKTKSNLPPVYIIRRTGNAGFFSNYFYVLGHCIIAEKNGWLPIVDMENYITPYNEITEIFNTRNAWEYYFHQPSNMSIENLPNDRTIILSYIEYPYEFVPYYSIGIGRYPNKKMVNNLQQYIRKFCKIKQELLKEFEKKAKELNLKECIGIHIRGTDMKNTPEHPIPMSIEKIIDLLEKIQKNDAKKIFLCTDEENIVNMLKEKFKDRLIVNDVYRSQDGLEGIHLEHKKHTIRKFHSYLLGKEVLKDAYLLSKCDVLIHGNSNVAYAAIVMNKNKFTNIFHYQ